MFGTLYVISVPIGNISDISLRAKQYLEKLKFFACEDTRDFTRLLRDLDIPHIPMTKNLFSCFEHNEKKQISKMIEWLKRGEDVGIVSSRGTPLISDPGYLLTRAAMDEGIRVVPLPGASSVMAALVASGLPADKFVFLGFPPRKKGEQRRFFEKFSDLDVTMVFFESPYRLYKTLKNNESLFGGAYVVVCRELTKPYEEILRGKYEHISEIIKNRKILGEVTVVISRKR
ncbi:MAG: 16S rRNA (cytidine(1402)-2'-O)-methyltransferase [Deltaproteobacteria bacterium]